MSDMMFNNTSPGQVLRIDTRAGKPVFQEFEVYPLVKETDPILKTPTKPFDFKEFHKKGHKFSDPENPIYLANSLFETLFKNKGLGLAAPQCGVPYAVFVMGTPDNKQIMFNPVIIQESTDRETSAEGCLSYPHLFVKIPRSTAIRVTWDHADGTSHTGDFVGLTARVIQHEIEHLRGHLFYEKAGKTSLQMAREQRRKAMKKEARK